MVRPRQDVTLWLAENIDVTGKLKDWIKYAQDAPIWKELIRCMLDPQRKLPARPNWESRDSSNTGANSQSNQSNQRQEQSGPRRERTGRRPPPRAHRDEEPTNRQWNPEGVGRNLFDSFGVLGLGFDATEMDVNPRTSSARPRRARVSRARSPGPLSNRRPALAGQLVEKPNFGFSEIGRDIPAEIFQSNNLL